MRLRVCVEFTSYEVKECKRAKRVGLKTDQVNHEKARLIAYGSIHEGFNDGIRESFPNADSNWMELTAGVVDAIDDPQVVKNWTEGRKVFGKAHLRKNSK